MKKLFLICFMLVAFVATNVAQDLSVKASRVYSAFGSAKDTINKNQSLTYTVFVQNYASVLKLSVVQDTVSGPDLASTQTIIQTSLDYANWTNVDTLNVVGNTFGTTDLILPYANYLKFTTKAIDSTAKVIPKYYMLIEKRP
jgi:hypothetical protein